MKLTLFAILISLISWAVISQDDFGADSISFDDQIDSEMTTDEMAPTPTPFPSDEDDFGLDSGESIEDMEID
jgi:hypothetical protein